MLSFPLHNNFFGLGKELPLKVQPLRFIIPLIKILDNHLVSTTNTGYLLQWKTSIFLKKQ